MVAELGDHVELLEHRDHVANVAKVFDSRLLVGCATLAARRLVDPLCRSWKILDHGPQVVFEELSNLFRLLLVQEDIDELICYSSRLVSLALVLQRYCFSRNIVQVLVEEFVHKMLSFRKFYDIFIV